jgi:two-component system phosphate regulon sensor histidine kinase PhoR
MKKVFPSIIILISISLLGLMFLQIYWIKNAVLVQKGKYSSDVEASFRGIKSGMQQEISKVIGFNPFVVDWESDDPSVTGYLWSNIARIPSEKIHDIIKKELDKNHIDLDFEFRITGSDLVTNSSYGYNSEMIPRSFQKALTYDGSYVFYLYIRQPKNYIFRRTSWMVGGSILFTIIIIIAFVLTVGTIFRQKKLSEMKSDFINNMTHEFKTPLATISLAVDALGYQKVLKNPTQINYYSGIIKEENARMFRQVEKILETAQLGTSILDLNIKDVDAHHIIRAAASNIIIRISEHDDEQTDNELIELKLNAKKFHIEVDEVHFSNIIANLLDNAIKYSKDPANIVIETANGSAKNNLVIKIKDNGIGMTKETITHIFEKFYRAHTGNLHNVKGFGLGLSYVKSVVDAHGAKIKVESTLGKGSTFILDFPLLHRKGNRGFFNTDFLKS